MSSEILSEIVQRAINDSDFRAKLASDPVSAVADFDLSDEERGLFAEAKGKDFDELLTSLETRVSKLTFIPPPKPRGF